MRRNNFSLQCIIGNNVPPNFELFLIPIKVENLATKYCFAFNALFLEEVDGAY